MKFHFPAKAVILSAVLSGASPMNAPSDTILKRDTLVLSDLFLHSAQKVLATTEDAWEDSGEDSNVRLMLQKRLAPHIRTIEVKNGDTPAKLADQSRISLPAFKTLNVFFGNLEKDTSKLVIRVGDHFVAPKDTNEDRKKVAEYLSIASKVSSAERVKQILDDGGDPSKVKEITERFFPSIPQGFGFEEMLTAMARMQEREFDPVFAPVVEKEFEKVASCANWLKRFIKDSAKRSAFTPEQWEVIMTQDLDAWLLPKMLRKFGLTEHFWSRDSELNLMSFFNTNPAAFTAERVIPMTETEKADYANAWSEHVIPLLKKSRPGTILPMYFYRSKSKWKVLAHLDRKDMDLNTHQTVLAWEVHMKFLAKKVPYIEKGVRTPFWEDEDITNHTQKILQSSLRSVSRARWTLLDVIEKEQSNNGNRKQEFEIAKKALLASIDDRTFIATAKLSQVAPEFLRSEQISHAFVEYRNQIALFLKAKSDNEAQLAKNTKARQDPRPFVSYVLDFIQHRADYGGALDSITRGVAWEGIRQYGKHVQFLVNGKSVNLAQELEHYNTSGKFEPILKGKPYGLMIHPNDTIEIIDLAVADGEKQDSHEDETRHIMHGRIRFLHLEMLGAGYMVTKVLANEWEVFPASAIPSLKIRATYSLRPGQTLDAVLRQMVIKYDPRLKDVAKPSESAIYRAMEDQHFYLGMYGYMENPRQLNPGAGEINTPIPFFESNAWGKQSYIKSMIAKQASEQELVNPSILDINIVEGIGLSTKKALFRYISRLILASELRIRQYPELALIAHFDEFQYEVFMKRLFEISKHSLGNLSAAEFYAKIPSSVHLYISIHDLAKIASDINNISALAIPNIKEVDTFVINLAVPDEHVRALVKNILVVETYTNPDGISVRKPLKQVSEVVASKTGAHIISSLGDFQIRLNELRSSEMRDGRIVRVKKDSQGKEILEPIEWPNREQILRASEVVFSKEIKQYALDHFTPAQLKVFYKDVENLLYINDQLRKELTNDEISWIESILEQDAITDAQFAQLLSNVIEIPKDRIIEDIRTNHVRPDINRIAEMFAKRNLSNESMREIYRRLQKVIYIDSGNGVNIIGKTFSASMISEKILLHYQKTVYWLPKFGLSVDEIANNDAIRADYERMVMLTNNLSEDITLLAMTQNYIQRLYSGLAIPVPNRDVYASPEGFVEKAKQEIKQQVHYNRDVFLERVREIVEVAKKDIEEKNQLRTWGYKINEAVYAREAEATKIFEDFLRSVAQEPNKTNEHIFALFRNESIKEILRFTKKSHLPFQEEKDFENSEFANSIFGYTKKVLRNVRPNSEKERSKRTWSIRLADTTRDLVDRMVKW